MVVAEVIGKERDNVTTTVQAQRGTAPGMGVGEEKTATTGTGFTTVRRRESAGSVRTETDGMGRPLVAKGMAGRRVTDRARRGSIEAGVTAVSATKDDVGMAIERAGRIKKAARGVLRTAGRGGGSGITAGAQSGARSDGRGRDRDPLLAHAIDGEPGAQAPVIDRACYTCLPLHPRTPILRRR